MALPEAVQRQVEEAEALERRLYGTPGDEPSTPDDPTPPADDPHDEPVEPQEPPKTSDITPKPGREEDTAYWKERSLSAHGMLQQQGAEIQRLHAQLKQMTSEMQSLQAHKAEEVEKSARDKDAETFGEDLTEAIDRRAKAMAERMVVQATAQMQQYVRTLEEKLGAVDQRIDETSLDSFLGRLKERVPNYEALDSDPAFIQWLEETPALADAPRRAVFNKAVAQRNPALVADFFLAYSEEKGLARKSDDKVKARQELERQIAPSSPRGAPTATPTKRIWSAAEYKHATDPRRIREVGAEQANTLYAEAEAAAAEGRIQW